MLTRLANLGIRAPRRVLGLARAAARPRRGLRRLGGQPPDLRRLLRPQVAVEPGRATCCRRRSTPATANLLLEVTSPRRREQQRAPARPACDVVNAVSTAAVHQPGALVLDGAARSRPARWSARTASRRSSSPASPATTAPHPSGRPTSPRPLTGTHDGVTVIAGGLGDRLQPGQRPDQERPRQGRGDRHPAHRDRADLGLRQLHRRAAAARRRAVVDHRHDGDPARARRRSPTCRSTR